MNFIENETVEKLRGGYYTPPDIARFLTAWVLAKKPRTILEPSCGDGAFLAALRQETAPGLVVTAVELDPPEAAKARTQLGNMVGEVLNRDFLRWALDRMLEQRSYDAVVGNPPFIRYQYLDAPSQEGAAQIFDQLSLPFTKHTNAWVPFVLASVSLLRPGGRLAMVIPSELLHVLHAGQLRKFLIRECSSIAIVDPKEIWFEGTLQGVVLLMLERREHTDSSCLFSITPVTGRDFLNGSPVEFLAKADAFDAARLEGKWTASLLSAHERSLLTQLEDHDAVQRFGQIADIDVGIVTGANKFFLVDDATVREYSLDPWAHPMYGRSDHVRGVVYDQTEHERNRHAGNPTNFLWLKDLDVSALPEGLKKYISIGESEGLHNRYKCRIRTPWWTVPSVASSPIGMLKRSHSYPRLVLNSFNAYTTDTAYRLRPLHGHRPDTLVFGFVNSLTMLSAELEGRFYGGGVLELVPSEIERLIMPATEPGEVVEPGRLSQLNEMFVRGDGPEAILAHQDAAILEGLLELSPSDARSLREAWSRLRWRRQRITDTAPLDELDDTEQTAKKTRKKRTAKSAQTRSKTNGVPEAAGA